MRKTRQGLSCLGLAIVAVLCFTSGTAGAEPIRVTVDFTVTGDPRDPEFGLAAASGSASVLTTLPAPSRVTRNTGFGVDEAAFEWGGATWTESNADLIQLGFTEAGVLDLWRLEGAVGGAVSGITSGAWPDFVVSFCGFCLEPFVFLYTTPLTAQLGIFEGRVTSFAVETSGTPAPVPEPMSLALVGSGLLGVAVRALRRRSRSPGLRRTRAPQSTMG